MSTAIILKILYIWIVERLIVVRAVGLFVVHRRNDAMKIPQSRSLIHCMTGKCRPASDQPAEADDYNLEKHSELIIARRV